MAYAQEGRRHTPRPLTREAVLGDGLFAGIIGAGIVMAWFFVIDSTRGKPLYTPLLLGNLILHGPQAMGETLALSPQPIAVYTGLHVVTFVLLGIAGSYLWSLFDLHAGIGIVLAFAFVLFEAGFFILDLAVGHRLLGLLGVWAVGVGNLLSAVGMGLYFHLRHPNAIANMKTLWTEE
jgi:hypothetical protein